MEQQKKTLTKEEFDRGVIPQNVVLCESFYSNEDAKTKAGIIVGFLNENTYASEDGKDTSSHIADMAETALKVVKLPEKLYFNPEDKQSMDWETEIELVEDDEIYTNPIDALNSVVIVCDGKEYNS